MKNDAASIELDHIGIAVRSLEESLRFYRDLIGLDLKGKRNRRIRARECCYAAGRNRMRRTAHRVASNRRTANLLIGRFLQKHGPGLHHIALRVEDLRETAKRLESAGARLLNEPRSGAGGHTYVFVHPSSAAGVLLELIQR